MMTSTVARMHRHLLGGGHFPLRSHPSSHTTACLSVATSGLHCVFSHWAHFTVRCFIFLTSVYNLCFFILHTVFVIVSTVGQTWREWSLILRPLSSFGALKVRWVIWPVETRPDMTYNVFGGTLNLTKLQLLHVIIIIIIVGFFIVA